MENTRRPPEFRWILAIPWGRPIGSEQTANVFCLRKRIQAVGRSGELRHPASADRARGGRGATPLLRPGPAALIAAGGSVRMAVRRRGQYVIVTPEADPGHE